jgi:hypothetical protein
MKRIAPVLALFAGLFALGAPVTAAAAPAAGQAVVLQADMDGDGRPDRVSLAPATDAANQQILAVTLGRLSYVTRLPLFSPSGEVYRPEVVNLDNHGAQELLIAESIGANTVEYTVWSMADGGLSPVRMVNDTRPFRLSVSESRSVFARYHCVDYYPSERRELVSITAELDEGSGICSGTVTVYDIFGGVATPLVSGPSIAFHSDPGSCQ